MTLHEGDRFGEAIFYSICSYYPPMPDLWLELESDKMIGGHCDTINACTQTKVCVTYLSRSVHNVERGH